jgi:hypothetical protein
MSKVASYLGGVAGGWFLTDVSSYTPFLASANSFFDIVGALSVVVFSGALIYHGAKELLGR